MRKDISNVRFGKLVAIEPVGKNKFNQILWLCKCDCKKEKVVPLSALTSGDTTSCGCLHDELFEKNRMRHSTHNHSNSRLFNIWVNMKQRCYNQNNPKYHRYGGRGITICEEWLQDFQTFYDWAMANGYADDLTIDRKDNDGNYEPSNCRWITKKEQANNVSYNLIFKYKGEEKTLKQWSEDKGINYHTLYGRIQRGWDIERALEVAP